MTDLEMRVEALTHCVPSADFEAALAMVKNANRSVCIAPEAIAEHTDDIEAVICGLLTEIGIPESVRGHRYLVTGLALAQSNPGLLDAFTKELYPSIAEAHGTRPSCVERSIRHAIQMAWTRADWRTLERYFGNTVHPNKGNPTCSEFITRMHRIVRVQIRGGRV